MGLGSEPCPGHREGVAWPAGPPMRPPGWGGGTSPGWKMGEWRLEGRRLLLDSTPCPARDYARGCSSIHPPVQGPRTVRLSHGNSSRLWFCLDGRGWLHDTVVCLVPQSWARQRISR